MGISRPLNLEPARRLASQSDLPFYYYDLDHAFSRTKWFEDFESIRSGKIRTHYAVKANTQRSWLRGLSERGWGADVVSGGELNKALLCGFPADRVIFSGVGKTRSELELAIHSQIYQINIESIEEIRALGAIAKTLSQTVAIAMRLNVLIEAPTHKNIQTATKESKFGIDHRQLAEALVELKKYPRLRLVGLAAHVGSQIMDMPVFKQTAKTMGQIYRDLQSDGYQLSRLDLGGGLGIDYRSEGEDDEQRLDAYLSTISKSHGTDATVLLEPGRFLIARSGVLLAQVVYVKQGIERRFLILNAGMNALMRPALYQAYHRIEPMIKSSDSEEEYCVVGPLCESTDVFAESRRIPKLTAGEWVVIRDAGAYGAVLASQYNECPRPKQWSQLAGSLECE